MGRKKQAPEESQKRSAILMVAGHMFMTQSYSDVSMDALAEAVPVSKRTLYNHFKDKESLFIAVMQMRCHEKFRRFAEVFNGNNNDVKATLTRFGEEFLKVILSPDGVNIFRTAIMQTHQFPEMGQLFYDVGPKRSHDMLGAYLAGLHKRKALHILKPKLAAAIFMGMLVSRLQIRSLLKLKKQVTPKEKEAVIRYAVEIFIKSHQYKK